MKTKKRLGATEKLEWFDRQSAKLRAQLQADPENEKLKKKLEGLQQRELRLLVLHTRSLQKFVRLHYLEQ
jgi:prolyl oligopeptidase PreP (S9A serine peptidase family)